ncbi:MAG: hypothetical protein ACI9FJ_003009 [Alteromonadaceae bacterium]|jgi:hypothetical protein
MNQPEHSTASLIKATAVAVLLAAVILIIVILPAEYNIDPSGIGQQLGFTQINQPQKATATSLPTSLPKPLITNANTSSQWSPSTTTNPSSQSSDSVNVTVPPMRGVEYKFQLSKHQTMKYDWQTDGEKLYLDLHGEPAGDTSGYYESYTIATATEMKGQFTAPFSGIHGWYWKNTTDKPITVTLNTTGSYQIVGLK